jgi:hypothetical protein
MKLIGMSAAGWMIGKIAKSTEAWYTSDLEVWEYRQVKGSF